MPTPYVSKRPPTIPSIPTDTPTTTELSPPHPTPVPTPKSLSIAPPTDPNKWIDTLKVNYKNLNYVPKTESKTDG